MSAEEIQKYIDKINSNTYHDTIFLRPINKSVYASRVWDENPFEKKGTQNSSGSDSIFFIKNEENIVVAAVLDMRNDLHWYVSPKYRKKGYPTKSLKEVIIPYIFLNDFDDRDEQEISIKKSTIGEVNYFASKKVAKSIGFKSTNHSETKFILTNTSFDWSNHDEIQTNTRIDTERADFIKSKLKCLKLNLQMLDDELTMKSNDDSLQLIIRELEQISIGSIIAEGNSEIRNLD